MALLVYIYIFFLAIIFFIYGLLLSEIVDYVFPTHDELNDDYKIGLEIIGEMGLAYIIFFFFKKYIDNIIIILFKKISNKEFPTYINQILIFTFSYGIFKHLQKSTNKIIYIRKKYMNPFISKIPYCNFLII